MKKKITHATIEDFIRASTILLSINQHIFPNNHLSHTIVRNDHYISQSQSWHMYIFLALSDSYAYSVICSQSTSGFKYKH